MERVHVDAIVSRYTAAALHQLALSEEGVCGQIGVGEEEASRSNRVACAPRYGSLPSGILTEREHDILGLI